MPSKQTDRGTPTGHEGELWALADALREHVVRGLIFLIVHHDAATISSEIQPAFQA